MHMREFTVMELRVIQVYILRCRDVRDQEVLV